MRKKILILIFVVLFLAVAGGGFFWWWQGREIQGSPADYVIVETPEGTIVENKKAGLTVKAPDGWKVEKIELEEGAVNFYSLNVEVELRDGRIVLPVKNGCLIQTNVVYKKMDFEQIKEDAKYTHYWLGIKSEEFEEIMIKNYPAIKNIFDTHKQGPGIGIYLPRNNRGYAFYLRWGHEDKESCVQEFDKFLDTILIR